LLIHASRTIEQDGIAWTRQRFPEITLPDSYETGGIVGVVSLLEILSPTSKNLSQGASPWLTGPYGWRLEHARPLPFLRLQGQLGVFTAPPVAVAWLDHHGGRPAAPKSAPQQDGDPDLEPC
jgi:hypothetical protein